MADVMEDVDAEARDEEQSMHLVRVVQDLGEVVQKFQGCCSSGEPVQARLSMLSGHISQDKHRGDRTRSRIDPCVKFGSVETSVQNRDVVTARDKAGCRHGSGDKGNKLVHQILVT